MATAPRRSPASTRSRSSTAVGRPRATCCGWQRASSGRLPIASPSRCSRSRISSASTPTQTWTTCRERTHMSTLLIEGGHRLGGRVSVEGNKNAALPLLAACLLTDEECVLANVPRIGDVEVMARLLLDLGVEVHGIGTTTLRICAKQVRTHAPNRSLVGRLRGSVLLLGPLLARTGRAHIAPPGGDFPARRSISTHLG